MIQKALILGGLGQMGRLVARSLKEREIAVTLVDARAGTDADEANGMDLRQIDVSVLGEELKRAIAGTDCVWVCLPEQITLQMAVQLAASLPDGCLWVDTLSVKRDIVKTIQGQGGRLEALSINPMFAPAMGWAGQAVAVVEVSTGRKSAFMKELMSAWGARLALVSAAEHDRLTAAIQVATHAAVLAFGAVLLELRIDLEKTLELATPPHRLLLTLLHRMTTQSSDVYWDIQAYHPLGGEVRQTMTRALERISKDAEALDVAGFAAMLAEVKTLLETRDDLFREWAKQAFAIMRQ